MMVVVLCCFFDSLERVRKGEELKAPRYASAAASCDDHVTIHNIIPNTSNSSFVVAIYI